MSYDRVKRPTGAGTRVLCVRLPVYYGYRLSCIDRRVGGAGAPHGCRAPSEGQRLQRKCGTTAVWVRWI